MEKLPGSKKDGFLLFSILDPTRHSITLYFKLNKFKVRLFTIFSHLSLRLHILKLDLSREVCGALFLCVPDARPKFRAVF
jgi:hypothetical protein